MPTPPPLAAPVRDAWLLAGAALEAGWTDRATQLADRAIEESGWGAYQLSMSICGVQIRHCNALPRGWGYHVRIGWDQLLLVHSQGREFITEAGGFGALMAAVYPYGGGLIPIGHILGAQLAAEVAAPDRL